MPFWYDPEPAEGGECLSVGQVFEKMVARLPGILSGVQLFRPWYRPSLLSLSKGLPFPPCRRR